LSCLGCLAPYNGHVDCGSGFAQTTGLGDNCTFTCNTGYLLYGNVTNGTCESSGNWSRGNPTCLRNYCCPNHMTTFRTDKYSHLVQHTTILAGCGLQYQSKCNVSCDYGYTGNNITYLCDVHNASRVLDWIPVNDAQPHLMCDIGLFRSV